MDEVEITHPEANLPHIVATTGLHSGAQCVVASDRLAIRHAIAGLESALHEATALQVHLEPVHRFAQGLYSRELTLPAGTIAVGHRHAQEHICIVSAGECEVLSETGGARVVKAPATFIVPPETKNCVRALTDTVWTTVHATDLRDVDAVEAALLMSPDRELLS